MAHEKKQQQPMQQNIIDQINNALYDDLTTTHFRVDRLSMQWRMKAYKALEFASPHSLGVSGKVFMDLVLRNPGDFNYHLSFFEFATLSNNLEMRSARDLDFGDDLKAYAELMLECMEHVEYYQPIVEEMKKKAQEKVAKEHEMKKTAAGDRGGLSPVKAEA
jgi:hypothetical protein